MELNDIRKGINEIDEQIEALYKKRMALCVDVARYKQEHDLPVFQISREQEILDRVTADMPEDLAGGAGVLFSTLMDISKLLQYEQIFKDKATISTKPLDLDEPADIAVPGISGSFTHIACRHFSDKLNPKFFDTFRGVFSAVEKGVTKFGIVPIVNSTAGTVGQTYELLKEYDLKICGTLRMSISHCLAAREGVSLEDITEVHSHSQALEQCSHFIAQNGFSTVRSDNTSLAAQTVAESDKPIAAICSVECAHEQGLIVLKDHIADADRNYTRFILIAKEAYVPQDANIISVSLSLPHRQASLYRLLTKFAASGLNLIMIESRQIANTDFDVVFYLDFIGSLDLPQVRVLLGELEFELSYFKFLGSYKYTEI